ncbi:hypothetical protein AOLI_G00119870 [Acnodon oligacanthus]
MTERYHSTARCVLYLSPPQQSAIYSHHACQSHHPLKLKQNIPTLFYNRCSDGQSVSNRWYLFPGSSCFEGSSKIE